jgi:hypothetical protein
MARKLNDAMSSEVHINNSLRHSRRCKQTKGAEIFVTNLSPLITDLEAKSADTKKERLLQDNAYDDLVFNEGGLDDRIRTISDVAKQYDRENPGRPVHELLFPNGGYSIILRFSIAKKANTAEEIKERIKSLGLEHSLSAQITPLEESITKVRTALSDLQQAKTKVRTAIANEEIAQANLRKQYEFNYLDAIKMFGKKFANRLFPQTVSKKKLEEELAPSEA